MQWTKQTATIWKSSTHTVNMMDTTDFKELHTQIKTGDIHQTHHRLAVRNTATYLFAFRVRLWPMHTPKCWHCWSHLGSVVLATKHTRQNCELYAPLLTGPGRIQLFLKQNTGLQYSLDYSKCAGIPLGMLECHIKKSSAC